MCYINLCYVDKSLICLREWMQKEEQAKQVQKEQTSRVLCGSHESKAKELGKGGRKAMKSDRKRWSTGGTSVTSETLIPAQTPMCTLCSGLYIGWLEVFFLLQLNRIRRKNDRL